MERVVGGICADCGEKDSDIDPVYQNSTWSALLHMRCFHSRINETKRRDDDDDDDDDDRRMDDD